jgi:uncharacterized protein (DUF58 family)
VRQLAAALAYLMLRQNDAVGMFAFASGQGRADSAALHDGTCAPAPLVGRALTPGGITNFASSLHLPRGADDPRGLVVILSDLLDEPDRIEQAIHHFRHRKHGCSFSRARPPQEVSFNFEREAVYVDMESGERVTTRPQELRPDYRARVGEWRDRIRQYCIEKNAGYVPLTTDQPYDRALLEYLSKRARLL